ncbi:MAG TPA: YjbQ family protein, partial [Thermodesulfobacteriaceae bacterium]|nr:YjbQ family protein [Thermodesulfobacteriaceae bacterium]
MKSITINSRSKTEMLDMTGQIQQVISKSGFEDGLAYIYVPHTTGAVTVNEGADPAVKRDIIEVLNEIIPWNFDYRHMEGNSPAHIKTSLMGPGVHVIVENGRLCLGTWQKIFFCEFDGPRKRKV